MVKFQKILIIDDNNDISQIVGKILKRADYEVTCAESPKEIFSNGARLPDLIFLDYRFNDPSVNGLHYCRQLKTDDETKHIPVIIFTGWNLTYEQIQASLADGLLKKPFTMHELYNTITTFLPPVDAPTC